ncbi:hypothetical protein RhiirA5_435759 [Rhizophagus irregularis]|uniref:Uncharacterized protein n=1 Tax=Rhizophagus irregularis TaxID=588596 RepID=A0A2N0NMX6_9GLOM|nr:hypothetical protein RhiirA5_435759 [Rhizophagus irregularis]
MNILEIVNPAKCSEQDDESTKPDEGTIAGSLTQDEGQRLLLRERRLSIEEREVKLERERIEPMKLKKELNIN